MAVLLALSVLVGCGTTGGVGGGVVGFDQAGAVPTVTAFSISPKTITLNAAQTVQFSLTARLSNGAIIDGASRASFVSSNANVTVSPTGLATGQLPGSAVITATIGGLTDTATVTVNPFTDRLFVSNLTGNSISVFDPAANGDVLPLGTVAGNATLLNAPTQLAVVGPELFVSNANGVTVHNLHARGNVAPKRTISGAATTITDGRGIAVFNNEIYVTNFNPAAILVFPAGANGNIAPTRTITGATTLLAGPRNISIFNNEIMVANGGGNHLLGFPVGANGNVAPTRNISGALTTLNVPVGMLSTATDIFCDNAGSVLAFAPGAVGNTAPVRTIAGALANINDPRGLAVRGAELFQTNFAGNRLNVFPTNANGNVAPTRSIVGANTGLSGPSCPLIAPSVI